MARAKKKPSKKKAASKKKTASRKQATPAAPEESAATSNTLAPLEDIEKLFDDFLQRRWFPRRWDWPAWSEMTGLLEKRSPSVDIVDRPKELLVRAEVPGVDKEHLEVSLVDRTLTIKGTSRKEEKEERDDYFRHEIRSGAFSRSVLLPADVNTAGAKASFKDGVVELRLPKVRASKRRQIAVE